MASGKRQAEIKASTLEELTAYLSGAARDGTFSRRHNTWRLSQRSEEWLRDIRAILNRLGAKGWIYRESQRSVWTLETTFDLAPFSYPKSSRTRRAFARGYFDAEGGVPREKTARFYVQFCQKNLADLAVVHSSLEKEGISCGRLHNPSMRVDPEYWRFFVRAGSHNAFMTNVSSWHPIKRLIIERRLHRIMMKS